MKKIGILSSNNEITDSFANNIDLYLIEPYKVIENIKTENISLLFVDISFIGDIENLQFFLSKIRKKINNIPVVIILQTFHVKKINSDWYYNDFIIYPFRKGEIELRIHKFLSYKSILQEDEVLHVGKLIINKKEYSVFLNEQRIDFTYKEFELLCYMVENKGKVFSRNELLKQIWGIEYIGGTRTVDVHVRRLRSKLGIEFNTIIETIRNVGYRCIE